MKLNVAVQMDPLEHIRIQGDSTFAMMLEAQARGHDLFVYTPDRLALEGGTLMARGRSVRVKDVQDEHAAFGPWEQRNLSEADVVLLRQDPPFDMAYITTTHFLDAIHPKTLVVNNPAEVRNAPEKLYVTTFPGVQPPTLITSDVEALYDFRARHGDIVLKPPAVTKGDKRILLVDGEPVGAINRVPAPGQIRSNLAVGGRADAVELTARDLELCAIIGPQLRARGLLFVGVDVIGDYLTEINVTSPTGARALKRLSGVDAITALWDVIERKRAVA